MGMANTDAGETIPRHMVVLVEDGRATRIDAGSSWSKPPPIPATLDRLDFVKYGKWALGSDSASHPVDGFEIDCELDTGSSWKPSLQEAIASAVVRYGGHRTRS